MGESTPRFTPLTVASRPTRIVVALAGPLLWLVAFIILAVVAHETAAVALGLAIAFGSFLVAVVVLIPTRRRRIREEAEAGRANDR
jgi:Cu/Ag efflux pump CusA